MESVYAHIAMKTNKPLLLAFAGLSGHGKTELAKQMGSVAGYVAQEDGSPLNNFLEAQNGQRCVVFLDEFDKTENKVRESLLKVMDTGMYRGRRPQGQEVDASRCRILASNLGDSAITKFHSQKLADLNDDDVGKVPIEPLKRELAKLFTEAYSPAIAGRINVIVPFFPFSPYEQAVVAHKFLLEIQDEARLPICTRKPELRLVGHAHFNIVGDGVLCQHVAEVGYVKELGARSIRNAVLAMRSKRSATTSR
ncbi:hypothetical protein LTR37_011508 [Vermiconidia calcicola]|uniref:Uncharacterized protein n=1 Tax=Vermiconidia calcicola TaxID=1690605 RepID=A0ACC3N4Q9_9PEZI|nr:hypothetical protein LTR37_011508 [Vermiconidia calcicola]